MNTSDLQSNNRGLVLAAHGARDQRTVDAAYEQASMISERLPHVPIETGFLEFTRPTIAEAIAHMATRGVSEMVLVPLFLAAGAHVGRDLPAIVREGRARYGDATLRLTPHVGAHTALLAGPTDAIGGLAPKPTGTVAWDKSRDDSASPNAFGIVLLAHGSRRGSAIDETRRLAEQLAIRVGAARHACGFLAMGEPRADAVLRDAAAWPVGRVIVHGHLLFPGRMIDTVDQLVEAMRTKNPDRAWHRTGPLGPSEGIARAASELFTDHSGKPVA